MLHYRLKNGKISSLSLKKESGKFIALRINRMLRAWVDIAAFWPYRYMRNGHRAMKYMYYLAQGING